MLQQLGYIHNKFSYLHWHVISKKWYSYTFLHCPADNMQVFYAFRQQPLPAIFDVNKMCFKLSSWFRLNSFLRISSLFEETNSRFHSLMIFILIYLSARTNMLETQTLCRWPFLSVGHETLKNTYRSTSSMSSKFEFALARITMRICA